MSDTADERTLRFRALLGRWFWVLAVALVVLAVLTGWIAYSTHVTPGTHAEQRVETTWSTEASLSHEALVTGSNPVFPQGTTLQNRTVYYRSIAPTVNGTYTFGYGSSVDGSLAVETTVLLQLRSLGGDQGGAGEADDQTVYWETSRELTNTSVTGVNPGERVLTTFRVNTTEVAQRLDEIEASLGGSTGTIQTRIVVVTAYRGSVAGTQVDERAIHHVPITIEGETYGFGDTGPWRQEREQIRQVQVPNEYGPLREIVAPVLSLLSLLGLLGLAVARHRGLNELTSTQRATLAFFRNRSSYDEWITRARLPDGAIEEQRAKVSTLEDLVDLAIDTDERVIEDPYKNAYIVQHEGVTYVYSPPVQIESGGSGSPADPL
jgi:hypothetical protein